MKWRDRGRVSNDEIAMHMTYTGPLGYLAFPRDCTVKSTPIGEVGKNIYNILPSYASTIQHEVLPPPHLQSLFFNDFVKLPTCCISDSTSPHYIKSTWHNSYFKVRCEFHARICPVRIVQSVNKFDRGCTITRRTT